MRTFEANLRQWALKNIGWKLGMTEITGDLVEKILLRDPDVSKQVTGFCKIKVPGFPVVDANVKVRSNSQRVVFDLPKTKINENTEWIDFVPGEAGELVHDENYGEVQGESNTHEIKLLNCLANGRCWHEEPVKFVESKNVSAHQLILTSKTKKQSVPVFESYILKGFDLHFWPDFSDQNFSDGSFNFAMDRLEIKTENGSWMIRRIDDQLSRFLFMKGSKRAHPNYESLKTLVPLLSFLIGRRVYIIKKELTNSSGDLVQEVFMTNTSLDVLPKLTPALPLNVDHESQEIYSLPERFLTLSKSYLEKREEIFIEEAIHHLLSALSAPLESKFAFLSIAFETLSSSFARFKEGGQEVTPKYLKQEEFRRGMKKVMKEFKKEFAGKMSAADYSSIEGKMYSSNNKAMGDRFKILLDEVGIVLSSVEAKVLKKRNAAIHEGVLARDRDDINWQEIIEYEGIMHTIINRLILRLIGYEGQIIDFGVAGHPERNV